MQDFWFYIKLGFEHVLDLGAYDHILFLAALAIPYTFKSWKKVLVLATIFTVAHCTSLALSVYELATVNVGYIEFLIPVTIALMALFNILATYKKEQSNNMLLQALATTFFGLIHGFGFSNYFNMLMAEEVNKLNPLLGFASGIELSQVAIILGVLAFRFALEKSIKPKEEIFIGITSILIILVTIPMLIATFPL
ncbi:MAG: HupE/UreJ family protein [Croceitalea sp.]|nr:HupE/UreJ family protein [Croceitalea sp.]